MPGPLASLQPNAAVAQPDARQAQHEADLQRVAKQFESVLLSQLLDVLWKTTPSMSDGHAGMYRQMFQGPFAEHLAASGGIGLAPMIAKSLGAQGAVAAGLVPGQLHRSGLGDLASQPGAAVRGAGATHGPTHLTLNANPRARAVGALADLQRAAAEMLQDGGERWAKAASLRPQDLQSSLSSEAAGGVARFSVRDANGYQGYYKCNLFAFELARRAGLSVPVVARESGWGFPSSNRITHDASDGSLEAGWAKVATGASPAAMQDALRAGEAAFLLVGSGQGERHGHMAVLERPHSIDRDAEGQVQRIVFDGWEAQPDGARHLVQRAWNRLGHAGAPGDRNGLTRIEIIQLARPPAGEPTEQVLSHTANSSRLDSVSSNEPYRPTQGGKEHS